MLDPQRRRNVDRVALACLAGAWWLIEVVDTLTPYMLPARAFRAIVIVAGVSFIPALVVVAVFESAPDSLWLDRQRC